MYLPRLSCFVLGLALSGWTLAAELVVLVDASTEMPWSMRQGDTVVGGIHRDLGDLLAERLGRTVQFKALPRKRLASALAQGEGDVLCGSQPAWLPGPFDWSRPALPQVELLVSLQSVPRPLAVTDLAGLPIGTINGFVYLDLAGALGDRFVRSDAPNAGANLRKLNLGRVQHATFNQQFLDYQRRQGLLDVPVHPYLVLSSSQTQCALSRRSTLHLAELDHALAALTADGSLLALLARYR